MSHPSDRTDLPSSAAPRSPRGPLLAWQLEHYPHNHGDRRNLVIHVVTVPIFMLATVALLAGLVTMHWPLALAGLLAMPLAVAAQGRGHARERVAPLPFAGPLDVVARIMAEQWITFPRFVLRGGLRGWGRAALFGSALGQHGQPLVEPFDAGDGECSRE